MPYYHITVVLHNKSKSSGIREVTSYNLEQVYRQFYMEAAKHYRESNIRTYDCVMISKQSDIYKDWLRKKQLKKGMLDDYSTFMEERSNTDKKLLPQTPGRKQYDPNRPGWGENIKKQKEAEEKALNNSDIRFEN